LHLPHLPEATDSRRERDREKSQKRDRRDKGEIRPLGGSHEGYLCLDHNCPLVLLLDQHTTVVLALVRRKRRMASLTDDELLHSHWSFSRGMEGRVMAWERWHERERQKAHLLHQQEEECCLVGELLEELPHDEISS
jgi:hypothetical protein